jgi:hypothetical protein
MIERPDIVVGITRDSAGRLLTYKDHRGAWAEFKRNNAGQEIEFHTGDGRWIKTTLDDVGRVVREDYNGGGWAEHAYHPNGRQQRLRTCDGVTWAEATYDEEAGRELTYRTGMGAFGENEHGVAPTPTP